MREKKKKKKFRVSVQKKYVVSGTIEVDAADAYAARMKVEAIRLQSNDRRISWDDPEYVDFSFNTTGEVDEV